jgi:hypothetical protein
MISNSELNKLSLSMFYVIKDKLKYPRTEASFEGLENPFSVLNSEYKMSTFFREVEHCRTS